MRVWILTVGEPLPNDTEQNRPWRSALTAGLLAERGHDVTWWVSTWDHFRKKLVQKGGASLQLGPRYRMLFLHGRSYQRNISWQRIANHVQIARHFRQLAPDQPRPDLILCSLPTLELPREAVRYGKSRGVPVVLDIRDLWPDFSEDLLPRWLRPCARPFLAPLRRDLVEACRGAAAIIGNSPMFVDWGVKHAGRAITPDDRFFPHAYSPSVVADAQLAQAAAYWEELGVRADDGLLNVCFLGTINRTAFDFDTVLAAAEPLADKARFIICGAGNDRNRLQGLVPRSNHIFFPGWVDEPRLQALLTRSHLGLAPYRDRRNFLENLPNKFIEYLWAGAPPVTCLGGYPRQLLDQHDCAYFYEQEQPRSLTEVIAAAAAAPGQRERRATAARALFETRFKAAEVYGALVDHLEVLASQGGGR